MKMEKYILEITKDELIAIGAELLVTKAYKTKLKPLKTFCEKVDRILQSYMKES